MAEGELGAVFRGVAKDAAAAGRAIADSVAKVTEETARIEEGNLAELAATDARVAERLLAAGKKPGPDLETSGGGLSRGPWPVGEGVEGPAKGYPNLRAPNKRHTVSGAKSGPAKALNTVALRGYEEALKEDARLIAAGEATYREAGSTYEVNGRTYRVEDGGTVMPVSGTGLLSLTRNEYSALQQIAKAGGDPALVKAFHYDPAFRDNPHLPELIAKVKSIYDGTYTP